MITVSRLTLFENITLISLPFRRFFSPVSCVICVACSTHDRMNTAEVAEVLRNTLQTDAATRKEAERQLARVQSHIGTLKSHFSRVSLT